MKSNFAVLLGIMAGFTVLIILAFLGGLEFTTSDVLLLLSAILFMISFILLFYESKPRERCTSSQSANARVTAGSND